MSSSGANATFLKSEGDIIIFLSCICGGLGLALILAVVGFMWEQCNSIIVKKTRNKRRETHLNKQTYVNTHALQNHQQKHDKNCENHYPTWLYDTMVHEQAQIMENYLHNDGVPNQQKQNNHDPENYINEVFSDIFDENPTTTAKEDKGVAYERKNKLLTPEKKPAMPVPYFHEEKNVNRAENKKSHLKISLDQEKTEHRKQQANGGIAIPLDDFDLDLFELDGENEHKETTKIVIPKELTIGERIKARQNNQTVEYENPRVLEKERRDRLLEEERREELRAKRVMLERSTSDLKYPKPEIAHQKSVRRIPADKPKQSFPTMEENLTQDSFMY